MALEYRILKNGNGKYKIQTKGWLWGWNDVKECIGSYAGTISFVKYFDSFRDACTWYQFELSEQSHWILADRWEVVTKKCSSILTSKEQNG